MTTVVILCGGKGTRLQELTGEKPKPMLEVGGMPMVWHIISGFRKSGYADIILATGYLGGNIRAWFRENCTKIEEHEDYLEVVTGGATIKIISTGPETLTGGRLLRLKSYLTKPFMMTYGDGISKVNPGIVQELGEIVGKNVVTVVHPVPRFGSVVVSPDGNVISFSEKEVKSTDWINGGFMYLRPEVLSLISGDGCNFEKDVLPKLAWNDDLAAYRYTGYWKCCDTLRDLIELNEDYKKGEFSNELLGK